MSRADFFCAVSMSTGGETRGETLKQHARNAVDAAFADASPLPEAVLAMEGMSGRKTRHLYNAMCALPGATYLEVDGR